MLCQRRRRLPSIKTTLYQRLLLAILYIASLTLRLSSWIYTILTPCALPPSIGQWRSAAYSRISSDLRDKSVTRLLQMGERKLWILFMNVNIRLPPDITDLTGTLFRLGSLLSTLKKWIPKG